MRAAPAPLLPRPSNRSAILPDQAVARHHAAGEEMLRDPVRRGRRGRSDRRRARWVKTCRNSRPSGVQPRRARASSSARQFIMCSNISTETTRSNVARGANTFMSAVTTRRLRRPRAAASASMKARCECELETAVIRARGNRSRHPQRQRAPAAAELEDALAVGEVRRGRRSRRSASLLGLRPAWSSASGRSSTNICAAARARGRRTPPAPRNAGRWPPRHVRRWRAPPSAGRIRASARGVAAREPPRGAADTAQPIAGADQPRPGPAAVRRCR